MAQGDALERREHEMAPSKITITQIKERGKITDTDPLSSDGVFRTLKNCLPLFRQSPVHC